MARWQTFGRFRADCSFGTAIELQGDNCLVEIHVGNVPFASAEDEIRGRFDAFGAVERVSLVTDRETGRSRGFCFVGMPNENEARAAVEALYGIELRGRALVINLARPRQPRPDRHEW